MLIYKQKKLLHTQNIFEQTFCSQHVFVVHIHFVVHMHFVAMGSAENFFYQNMTSIGKMGHLYFLWGKLKTNKQCRFKICIFFYYRNNSKYDTEFWCKTCCSRFNFSKKKIKLPITV